MNYADKKIMPPPNILGYYAQHVKKKALTHDNKHTVSAKVPVEIYVYILKLVEMDIFGSVNDVVNEALRQYFGFSENVMKECIAKSLKEKFLLYEPKPKQRIKGEAPTNYEI